MKRYCLKTGVALILVLSFLTLILPGHLLANEKKLTLYSATFPGFMGGSSANPGVLSEMVGLAADWAGYQFVEKVVPWPRALAIARTEENALIAGLTRLPSREANYVWISKQMELESTFIAFDQRINSYEEAKALFAIGVHRGSSHEVDLEERGFTNIRSFSKPDHLIKFFEHNRIDAWYGAVHEFSKRLEQIPAEKRKRVVFGKPVVVEELWLAGPKHLSPDVVTALETATTQIFKDGNRDRLMYKYFGHK